LDEHFPAIQDTPEVPGRWGGVPAGADANALMQAAPKTPDSQPALFQPNMSCCRRRVGRGAGLSNPHCWDFFEGFLSLYYREQNHKAALNPESSPRAVPRRACPAFNIGIGHSSRSNREPPLLDNQPCRGPPARSNIAAFRWRCGLLRQWPGPSPKLVAQVRFPTGKDRLPGVAPRHGCGVDSGGDLSQDPNFFSKPVAPPGS